MNLVNVEGRTRGGQLAHFWCRSGTTDADMVQSMLADDEYGLQGRVLFDWALDIGAHIGTVSVALALDHPALRVIAVEPVPENAMLLRENILQNGVADRVCVEQAAAARSGISAVPCAWNYRHVDGVDDSYVAAHRFVSGIWKAGLGEPARLEYIRAVHLDGLLAKYGISEITLLKIDCEGCEWEFLDTPSIARVRQIVGEYHDCAVAQARLERLLGATHFVRIVGDGRETGQFEAERKP